MIPENLIDEVEVVFGHTFRCPAVDGSKVTLPIPLAPLEPSEATLVFRCREMRWEPCDAGCVVSGPKSPILFGCLQDWDRGSLRDRSRNLYRRLLRETSGNHLVRLWNYIPGIHKTEGERPGYWSFNEGRYAAFQEYYGTGAWDGLLPAATGVGAPEDAPLTILFCAARRRPEHLENPRQMSAYRYPEEHGPRPPCFARATRLTLPGANDPLIWVAGTSSIMGHSSVGSGDVMHQLDTTLRNLDELSRLMGLGSCFLGGRWARRVFFVYLRHPRDLEQVRARLRERLFREGDEVRFLSAQICRPELEVEIEASLVPARSP